jgi:hypothetical protein
MRPPRRALHPLGPSRPSAPRRSPPVRGAAERADPPKAWSGEREACPNEGPLDRARARACRTDAQMPPLGLGRRSSKSGSRLSALAAKVSIMSVGWNMPVCQVAM